MVSEWAYKYFVIQTGLCKICYFGDNFTTLNFDEYSNVMHYNLYANNMMSLKTSVSYPKNPFYFKFHIHIIKYTLMNFKLINHAFTK